MALTDDLFAKYKAAGGTRPMSEVFHPARGLIAITWDGKSGSIAKWDARLTDVLGLARPADADVTTLLRIQYAASVAPVVAPAAL